MQNNFFLYHACNYKNRSRNQKMIDFKRGENCFCPTLEPYWRTVKEKYLCKLRKITKQYSEGIRQDKHTD